MVVTVLKNNESGFMFNASAVLPIDEFLPKIDKCPSLAVYNQ